MASSTRSDWSVALGVLIVDVAFVTATVLLDLLHHVPPPAGDTTDTSAVIGWLGVFGAVVAFGCYGILIKMPAVVEAHVHAMIFTQYYGVGTACLSFVIWVFAGSHAGLTLTFGSFTMGALFGILWIAAQSFAYVGVQTLGLAVGPAIWIGVTICVSFVWGTLVFGSDVKNVPGAVCALLVILTGVCLAAASSRLSERRQSSEARATAALCEAGNARAMRPLQDTESAASREAGESGEYQGSSTAAGVPVLGLVSCVTVGLFNGSLMVPLRCFQLGCPSIGIAAYNGSILAPLAFLPSLSLGLVVVLPVFFVLCYWRDLRSGHLPNFHVRVAALPGFLTGLFWGMGNFNAMFATVYLGQTIGFPLTQCCLIITGLWGILYYKEICGVQPIGLFMLASAVIICGATLDGAYG